MRKEGYPSFEGIFEFWVSIFVISMIVYIDQLERTFFKFICIELLSNSGMQLWYSVWYLSLFCFQS